MHVGDDRRDDSTSNPSARYIDEFRRETADYIISTGRPITQCRSELGLNSNTVRKWSRTAAASLRASPIREVLSARQVLGPHSVQGARAEDTRPHTQRREAYTVPDPKARRRPDLVRRDFNSPVPTYKLVDDITYLRTREGRLYLSMVIDPNTHMMVGRSLSARFDGRHRDIGAGVGQIARLRGWQRHIPRRPQRPARQQAFVRVGARQQRAADLQPHRTGSCHDNAVAESFFATLKDTDNGNRAIDEGYRRKCARADAMAH